MDNKKTYTEEVNAILNELNLDGELNATPAKKLVKDDEFRIVRLRRINDNPIQNGFVPLVFETDNGAVIGTKQFVNIEGYEGTSIGRTVADAAQFLCENRETVFHVDNVKNLPKRLMPGVTLSKEEKDEDGLAKDDTKNYQPKQFTLSIA